ncbi:MAG: hypothetical protein WCI02_14310 [Planctomycetota bacterium]
MPNQDDDLNRLDLGLPEFQSAQVPTPQTPNPSDTPDSLGADGSFEPDGQDYDPSVKAAQEEKPIVPSKSTKLPAQNVDKKQPVAAKPAPLSKGTPAAASKVRSQQATAVSANPVSKEPFHIEGRRGDHRSWWSAAPSWAVSTALHVSVILGLAAWNIEPIQKELKLLLNVGEPIGDEADGLEEFAIDNTVAEIQSDSTEEMPADAPAIAPTIVDAKVNVDLSGVIAASAEVSIPSISQSLVPSSGIAAQSNAAMRAALNSRSKETKRELLKKYGGTTETERAVAMALKWLAEHQNRETGAWTFAHPLICGGQCDRPGNRGPSVNAATGLALMCFLGAGQTHMEGEYKETVFGGLSFLIQNIRVKQDIGGWSLGSGFSGEDSMYSHGIAAIAMCEAYGMTRDERLLEAAQLSINYLTYAQNPLTGGWHYTPFPEGNMPGDTSVVGWQMMAIKSAAMAGLNVDLDAVRRANVFLDTMLVPQGFGYHYSMDEKVKNPLNYRPAMTACGVLCRMYSGWNKEEPTIKAAAAKFAADGPIKGDIYYNYYATQVMKQYGGAEWEAWNNKMRELIVTSQVQTGHGAGSWYVEDAHSVEGGRLYITCMSTMMLEVYYRYMPLYGEQVQEDPFQL